MKINLRELIEATITMDIKKITYEQLRQLPIGTEIITWDTDEEGFIRSKITEHDFLKISQGENVKLQYRGGFTLVRPDDKSSSKIYIITEEGKPNVQ